MSARSLRGRAALVTGVSRRQGIGFAIPIDGVKGLLKSVLAELKMNYVETMNEKPAEPAPEKKPEQAG